METEIPNNTKPEEFMDFKKFVQSVKGLMFSDEKVLLTGVFKGTKTNQIISDDIFTANKIWESGKKLNAELIYRTYLEYFNRILRLGEEEREFVEADIEELKKEGSNSSQP